MLSSSWALLVAVLPFVNLVLAEFTFSWPSHPEANTPFLLNCSGGYSPYAIYVFEPGLVNYYYYHVYDGGDLSYDFPLSVGTRVVFQCIDGYGNKQTSETVAVIETLYLQNVSQPEVGVTSVIHWGGGLPPYKVYVLTADQPGYYWNYTGSETSQHWTPDMDPGTQVVIQVFDLNGINSTSGPLTVQGNATSSSEPVHSSTMSVASVASISSLSVLSTSTHESTTTSDTPSESTTTLTAPKSTTTFITPSASNTSGTYGGKGPNVVAIVAGVVGGVVGLTLIGALWMVLAKQCSAGREDGAHMEMGDNDYVSRGQGGNPIGQPASPTVDPFGDMYAPNAGVIAAGAGDAGIGGAVRGAGVSGNPLTPGGQLHGPGGIYLGAHTGAADYVGRTRGPSSDGRQQLFPPHAIAASTSSGGLHPPTQVDASDSDSGYGPGSSRFH